VIPVREIRGGISFSVKVHPRARRNAITGEVGESLKLSLTTPPVDGRANQAVIDFLSHLFEIPRSSVTIASGATSRVKRIEVAGISAAHAQLRLQSILDSG
jgi:uncharacterized protein (TIGR00251 family)